MEVPFPWHAVSDLRILFQNEKKMEKHSLCIAILVDYLYITFSDSRTAEVTMAVSVAAGSFSMIYGKQKKEGKRLSPMYYNGCIFAGAFIGATSLIKSQYNGRSNLRSRPYAQTKQVKYDSDAKANNG